MGEEARIVDVPPEGVQNVSAKKPSPEQQRLQGLLRQLTDSSAMLVVKVATCKCEKKGECKVFIHAQKLAEVVDELQEISGKVPVGGRPIGKSGRRVRA